MARYRTNKEIIRAGSQERITFTLYSDYENSTVVNLTDYTIAELRIKRHIDNRISVFKTSDGSPILSFDGSRTTGKIHLDPLVTTFLNGDGLYSGYIVITHNAGKKYAYEEDEEFGLEVRDQFTTTSTSTT